MGSALYRGRQNQGQLIGFIALEGGLDSLKRQWRRMQATGHDVGALPRIFFLDSSPIILYERFNVNILFEPSNGINEKNSR